MVTRRKFIRTVLVGGAGIVAAGSPYERVFAQAPNGRPRIRTNRRHVVRDPAHHLRDGHDYALPAPSEFKDVVIVGAGANSLVAAYHLPELEVVCLEKEPRTGGNAQRSQWRGIYFTEGAAYTRTKSDLADFMKSEFDIAPTPVKSNIGYIVGSTVIPDFYQTGFDKLPFNESVRAAFHRFRDTCNSESERLRPAMASLYGGGGNSDRLLHDEVIGLESITFEQWLAENEYPQEVIDWCNAYCPTDAAGYPHTSSAISGIFSMSGVGNYDGSGSWPGGLATMAEKLAAGVRGQGANRIRTGTFVVAVRNTADRRHVDVTYLQAGILHTIRCKSCIWGGPKHLASYVVRDMPEEQKAASRKVAYLDISVMNLCYDRRIYDGALITWMNEGPINNILSADWVLNAGDADPDSPQVLTCDWTNRPEYRALLLDDNWVVEQCQRAAERVEKAFPGSIDHLVEIRLPLRAHSWEISAPGHITELEPLIKNDVGRVIMTESDHGSFMSAHRAGLDNAAKAKDWMS